MVWIAAINLFGVDVATDQETETRCAGDDEQDCRGTANRFQENLRKIDDFQGSIDKQADDQSVQDGKHPGFRGSHQTAENSAQNNHGHEESRQGFEKAFADFLE